MSSFQNKLAPLPVDLADQLKDAGEVGIGGDFKGLLTQLLDSCRVIADNLRYGDYGHDHVGTTNSFGDHQLEADVKADELITEHLRASGQVAVASSEENPQEIDLGGEYFSVAYDPLDGSSIIDANFAVGTIMGVWPGRGFLNRAGKEQLCALIAQYGPRVTVMLGLSAQVTKNSTAMTVELTMVENGWIVSIPTVTIAKTCKTFAPGNLRATSDNPKYKQLVDYYIDNKYTLRYSGGLVPDVYHIFIKKGGVLTNASSPSAKAKLRLLFEAAPIALIVEAAGGKSCVCPSEAAEHLEPVSILEVPVTDIDRRVGVCYGSEAEVDRFRQFLF